MRSPEFSWNLVLILIGMREGGLWGGSIADAIGFLAFVSKRNKGRPVRTHGTVIWPYDVTTLGEARSMLKGHQFVLSRSPAVANEEDSGCSRARTTAVSRHYFIVPSTGRPDSTPNTHTTSLRDTVIDLRPLFTSLSYFLFLFCFFPFEEEFATAWW